MSRFSRVFLFVLSVSLLAAAAFAQVGPPGGMIYAHNHVYRTVATPTTLPPVGKFDTIYLLGHGLANVADAAPGDQAYNGGRWEVRPVQFLGAVTQFKNAEDVLAAAASGEIVIGEVAKRFECPLIPVRRR